MKVIVTGSAGYVASHLAPLMQQKAAVHGVDQSFSKYTDIQSKIESIEFKNHLKRFNDKELTIVNLAAARFDFGVAAKDYYRLNVECHHKFLKSLINHKVKKFVHISSVAALDGRHIFYSDELNCDDAYRATKYLQEVIIQKWCDERDIELTILYPSAIFSDDLRSDTNIGKLLSISKFIPFIPKINVVKSLTYLPNFSRFIVDTVVGEIPSGKYITIEKPSLTVSEMIQVVSGRNIQLIHIPFFQLILKLAAKFLYALGIFGKIDLKLTPNRVVKLFSDTSYSKINYKDIDSTTYADRNIVQLSQILSNFNGK